MSNIATYEQAYEVMQRAKAANISFFDNVLKRLVHLAAVLQNYNDSISHVNHNLPNTRVKYTFRKLYGDATVENPDPQLSKIFDKVLTDPTHGGTGIPDFIKFVSETLISQIENIRNTYLNKFNDINKIANPAMHSFQAIKAQYESDYAAYNGLCEDMEALHAKTDPKSSAKFFDMKLQFNKSQAKAFESLEIYNQESLEFTTTMDNCLLMFEMLDKERHTMLNELFVNCSKSLKDFGEKNSSFAQEVFSLINSINSLEDVSTVFTRDLIEKEVHEKIRYAPPTFDFALTGVDAKLEFQNKLAKFTCIVTEDCPIESEEDLHLRKGDTVLVLSTDGPKWTVKNVSKQVGKVNSNKLQRLEDCDRALYKVIEPCKDMIQTVKDEIILVVSKDNEIAFCKNIYGMKGYIPLNTLQKIE